MRRVIGGAVAATLLCLASAAADEQVTAEHIAVVSDQGATADVVAVCTGAATRSTATVTITCSVATASGDVETRCGWGGPHGACVVRFDDATYPFTVCAEAVAHLRDGTTATDSDCTTYVSTG